MNPIEPSAADVAFRAEVRTWLADNLTGEFAEMRGLGGPGREDEDFEPRLRWNRHLAENGWTCVGWPVEHGGRGLTMSQQVIFHEEYARSRAPGRINHFGEELLGPTLLAFGTEEQKARFLPRHSRGRGAVVPGLLRARRGLRPGQRRDQGRPRWRRVGHRRPEDLDLARPSSHSGSSWCAARPRVRRGTRDCPSCSSRWTSRASRCGRSNSSLAAPSSTRCSSPGPDVRRSHRRRTGRRAGKSRWACSASNAASRRSGSRSVSSANSTNSSNWPSRMVPMTTRSCATGWPNPRSSWTSCAPTPSADCPASWPARTRRPAAALRRSARSSGPTGTSGSASSPWRCWGPTA